MKSILFTTLILLLFSYAAYAENWRIIDGDTIRHGETVIRNSLYKSIADA